MLIDARAAQPLTSSQIARKMTATSGNRAGLFKLLFIFVNATTILVILNRAQRATASAGPGDASRQNPTRATQAQQSHNAVGQSHHRAHSSNSQQPHPLTVITTQAPNPNGASPGQPQARLTTSSSALETKALNYLQRFGYMQAPASLAGGPQFSNNLISEESFSSAISEFQRFAGLPESGQVDNETLVMMSLPRCGNTDKAQNQIGLGFSNGGVAKSGQLRSFRELVSSASEQSFFLDNLQAKQQHRKRRRRKRYALQGSKWRRQELTYRISQYPTKFSGRRHEVDAQIERAFGIWSQVAPIDFVVKLDGRVHIDIRFASGDHGDGDAFDGPGNTLAHAYFPQYGGDAHFDDQEYWTIDSYAGTNIFQVAAHELGHSLGLGHSNVREALMAPFYQKYKPNFKLHIDDVLAIQALYGEKAFLPDVPELPARSGSSAPSTPMTTTTTVPPTTAITTTSTSTTSTTTAKPDYHGHRRQPPIYKGNKRPVGSRGRGGDGDDESAEPEGFQPSESSDPDLSSNGINGFGVGGTGEDASGSEGAPTLSPHHSPPATATANLCTDSTIDAATRTEDGNSYVFKGELYWLLTSEGLAHGYPRRIAADWDGLPGSLDAALTWADGKTFFFKGNKYWRFRNKRRDVGYPKLISSGFAGIPDDVDAAFVWSGNGRTYFFKGTEYWRFDSKAEPPVSSEYPRSVKVWLGVPAHINAAFKWENNVTYFFKGNQYYRFNDRDFKVESRGRPPFPRPTAEWWFGCVSSNLAQRAMPPLHTLQAPGIAKSFVGEQSALFAFNANPRAGGGNRAPALLTNGPLSQQQHFGDQGDWSLLAGLNADQTRSMGTHISDSHKPPPPLEHPATEEFSNGDSSESEEEEEGNSANRSSRREFVEHSRLGPRASSRHREPLGDNADLNPNLEDSIRKRLSPPSPQVPSSGSFAMTDNQNQHTTSILFGRATPNGGPHYQTSSSSQSAILLLAGGSLASAVLCIAPLVFCAALLSLQAPPQMNGRLEKL